MMHARTHARTHVHAHGKAKDAIFQRMFTQSLMCWLSVSVTSQDNRGRADLVGHLHTSKLILKQSGRYDSAYDTKRVHSYQ